MNSSISVDQLSILSVRPMIRPSSYTSFIPVTPQKGTLANSNVLPDDYPRTSIQSHIPLPRFPEVPIITLKQSSNNSSVFSNQSQGLLAPYIPAPYEQGPNGLSLIMPHKVHRSLTAASINTRTTKTTNGILSAK